MPASNLRRSGADQGDPTQMDADTLLDFVRMCLEGLGPSDRDEFVAGLSNLVEMEGNGLTATDARRGRRPAQDRALAPSSSFAERYPFTKNIKHSFGGYW